MAFHYLSCVVRFKIRVHLGAVDQWYENGLGGPEGICSSQTDRDALFGARGAKQAVVPHSRQDHVMPSM